MLGLISSISRTGTLLLLSGAKPLPSVPFPTLSMSSNTKKSSTGGVDKLQQIVHSDSTDGWERSWKEGVVPWDLGQPTPILLHLLHTDSLPKGRALVPGCGSGHDVVAIASPARYVVGLDISDSAIKTAIKISDHAGGPPYKVSVKDYEEVLHPVGFKAISVLENELSIGPRKGKEKLGRWKRSIQSLL